ncbi:MAG: efflux RND transporter periplasmic adaptor subunit [Gammaproteobacteria bacterium]|nr:efflux RND transporter periplasmic adaptor subunit [Gammaproteobacteria bacterium]
MKTRRSDLNWSIPAGCLLASWLLGAPLASAQQNAPTVVVSRAAQSALIEEVPLTGTVVSPRIAELSTEVSGIVDQIGVELGDRVAAGQQILRLNSELEALTLDATRASTEQARHELADARRRLAEARKLGEIQSVSAAESIAAEVQIDVASLRRAQAEEKHQVARLQRHLLNAPFAGVISRKLVEQGEWIQPGQAVVELVALDELRIDFQAPQSVYEKIGDSTRLRIKLDALSGRRFDGRIERIIPVNDPISRTFLIRAALDQTGVRLAPGMSASGVLHLDNGVSGVTVPRDAIIRYPDGRVTVWVAETDGEQARVRELRVQTGLGFGGRVAITSGLEAGALVVVRGNESLYEGQKVILREADS